MYDLQAELTGANWTNSNWAVDGQTSVVGGRSSMLVLPQTSTYWLIHAGRHAEHRQLVGWDELGYDVGRGTGREAEQSQQMFALARQLAHCTQHHTTQRDQPITM